MKYNNNINKIISMLLAIVIILSINEDVLAMENHKIKVDEKNIDECIIIAALDWAFFLHPEMNLEVGDIYQINVAYNLDEIEYAISYFDGVIPYGYAVVSFYEGQAIVKEASIKRGQEGIYTNLIDLVDENSNTELRELEIKGNIIELSPMKYCVVTEGKNDEIVSYDNHGAVYANDEISYSAYYSTIDGFYISTNNWVSSNYEVNESTKVILECAKNKRCLQQGLALVNANKYACSVQALYNISYWWGITGMGAKSMQKEYNQLWKDTNTYEVAVPEGYEYYEGYYTFGGTLFNNISTGYIKYLNNKGYKKSTYEQLLEKPTETWIKNKLKKNNPILMSYLVNKNKDGHTIAIMGIMDAKKVSSGNTWTYVMVADGWNATPTYFNYDYVQFADCKVISFDIK